MTLLTKVFLIFFLILTLIVQIFAQQVVHLGSKHISSIFWTWQDKVIENPDTLKSNIMSLKNAGFQGLYAMPRATRYHMYHKEMIDAVKLASEECKKQNIEFIWGLAPRFLSSYTLQQTGYWA